MSYFKNLFGNKKEEPASASESIQKLHNTESLILKKQEYLEEKVSEELEIAKKNASTNKKAAIEALKKKKRYEQQLEQFHGTLTSIETQREALENANTNAAVLESMKTASNTLKKLHKDMDVDKVQDIMDDINEQQEIANEFFNIISTGIVLPNAVDEDELALELEELEQEKLNEKLVDVVPTPSAELPDVPTTDLPTLSKGKKKAIVAEEMDDSDLRELEKWAN